MTKHFGVASKDPFEGAHCPACRAQVAPHAHYCKACFATYDPSAAVAQIRVELGMGWKPLLWLPLLPGIGMTLLGLLSRIDPEGTHPVHVARVGLALMAITPLAHLALWLFAMLRLHTIQRPVEPPPSYR